MITVRNVCKTLRGNDVLRDISMAFEPGRVVGLSGPNGSGKTMLMRIIAGLVRPTQGFVDVDGRVVGKDIAFPPSLGLLLEGYFHKDAAKIFTGHLLSVGARSHVLLLVTAFKIIVKLALL